MTVHFHLTGALTHAIAKRIRNKKVAGTGPCAGAVVRSTTADLFVRRLNKCALAFRNYVNLAGKQKSVPLAPIRRKGLRRLPSESQLVLSTSL